MIADILGALGICSAINAGVATSAAAITEDQIASVKAEMEELEKVFGDAEVLSSKLSYSTIIMQSYVEDEIDLINVWENAVDALDEKIEGEFLKTKLPLNIKIFEKAIKDLKEAAEEYSKRPDFTTELDQMFLNV